MVDTTTNRYSSSQGYTFDKNGNVTADVDPATGHSRAFTFNGDNKQTQVTDTTTSTTKGTYYYDGEGHRVKKVTASETTTFIYGNGQLLEERNSSGTLTTSYIYAGTQLPATETATDTNYTATDNLGTPRVITNSSGAVVARRDFLPFGEELFADGTYRKTSDGYTTSGSDTVRQRFTGYQRDLESGLDFAEARYYDNSHGRFTAIDPLLASGKSADPQTFNRYVYVGGSPLIRRDPTGLVWGYYDEDGKRHFHWFAGKAGKFEGHNYSTYKGPTTLENTNAGRIQLLDGGGYRVLKPVDRGSSQPPQSTAQGLASGGGNVNHAMIRAFADHTAGVPAFLAIGAGTAAVIGTGGAACLALCPELGVGGLTTLGIGGATAAAENPQAAEESLEFVEGLVVRFGASQGRFDHAMRHLGELGVEAAPVREAVLQDVQNIAGSMQPGQFVPRIINVGGQQLQYNAFKLPDGSINIGRINGPPFNVP